MAFPVNGVLDNFNRADTTSNIGVNWTSFVGGNEGILSNQLYNPTGINTNYSGLYWNPATFGPSAEVYLSFPTKSTETSNDDPTLYVNLTNPGAANEHSYNAALKAGSNVILISREDNKVGTQLGATIAQTLASADAWGLEIRGVTINLWYNVNATGWRLIGIRSDTSYLNAGYLGFYLPGNSVDGRFDDFGGGTIVSAFRLNNSGLRPRPFAPGIAR